MSSASFSMCTSKELKFIRSCMEWDAGTTRISLELMDEITDKQESMDRRIAEQAQKNTNIHITNTDRVIEA